MLIRFPFYYSFMFGVKDLTFLQSPLHRPTIEDLANNTTLTVHLQLGHPDHDEGFWDYVVLQSAVSSQKDITHNIEAFTAFGHKYEEFMEAIDWIIEDDDWRQEVFNLYFGEILEQYRIEQFKQ